MPSESRHRECGRQEGETRAPLPVKGAGLGCDQTVDSLCLPTAYCARWLTKVFLLSPLICTSPWEGDEPGTAHPVFHIRKTAQKDKDLDSGLKSR